MTPLTSESVDTRILPKYTLYIGPKGAPKTGNEAPGKVGAVLLLGHCTKDRISSEEYAKFLNDIRVVLLKGGWVRLSSGAYQPYRRYRAIVRFVFDNATFIERITLSRVSHAPRRK